MPVAADLAWSDDGKGRIVPGKETYVACARVARYALMEDPNAVVVITAGRASTKWKAVHMAHIMADDIIYRLKVDSSRVITAMADTFNTDGEMRTLADIIREQIPDCSEVVLFVKWWHGKRAQWLCEYHLKRVGLHIPVKLSPCPTYASAWTILKEQCFGMLHNRIRRFFRA